MRATWIAAVLLLAATACEQKPYRVFAVEVDAHPAVTTKTAPAAPVAAQLEADGLRARHPQMDLNRAPAQELLRLPGIDARLVAAIVAGRPYQDKRELTRRKLLTPAQYEAWKNYLVVHKPAKSAGASPPG